MYSPRIRFCYSQTLFAGCFHSSNSPPNTQPLHVSFLGQETVYEASEVMCSVFDSQILMDRTVADTRGSEEFVTRGNCLQGIIGTNFHLDVQEIFVKMKPHSVYPVFVCLLVLLLSSLASASCGTPANAIEAENCKPGDPASSWDLPGADAGDVSIQGFATDISVNVGQTAYFKVRTDATAYTMDIYRMGYYNGTGARKVASITPTATLPQIQAACTTDATTGLIDCGNWGVSASWTVPSDATSGIYFVKLTRTDTGGASHIVFIVRNDAYHSALLFQTSDTTWQAYNYSDGFSISGGNSLYGGHGPGGGAAPGRAYKVTYNRPFTTRSTSSEDFVFEAEYPMVRFLEANGFDVTYFTGVDAARDGNLIRNHKTYLSVGHDEYWSGEQRTNVEAARAAGVNLAFFSGNEIFWKARFEVSPADGSSYRTLVSYKETHAGAVIDPMDPPTWTGTWRDPRFSPPADGGRPENSLSGTIFTVNCCAYNITVPQADGRMRFWRGTSVASLGQNQTATLPAGTLGYEWDEDLDNGFRPAGIFRMSTTTVSVPQRLLDYGSTYGPGTATHSLTLYKHPSGALVFGAGTVQWAWGLDSNHDRGASTPDVPMQQATVNLFADMGVQPATLQAPLTQASASSDTTAPTSSINFPLPGGSVSASVPVTITGISTDTGGGVVGGVEVSVDGGATWHPATGRETWSYKWTPSALGTTNIVVRAVDDSGNLEGRGGESLSTIQVTVLPAPPPSCPCSIVNNSGTPAQTAANDHQGGIEVGVRFRTDVAGTIQGIQFYRGATDSGTYQVQLWDNSGGLLGSGSITFSGASSPAWQQVFFTTPVAIAASTPYVASVFSPNGYYAFTDSYFTQDIANPPLHGLQDGVSGPNGIYKYTSAPVFPSQTYRSSYYWVDVIFNTPSGPDHTPPTISAISPASGATSVSISTDVKATFDKAMNSSTINTSTVVLRDPSNAIVPAAVSYDLIKHVVTLSPSATLAFSTVYTMTISGGTVGVQDTSGNALVSNFTWSFTTAQAPPPPPNEGPGGPILIVSSAANPFSRYYVEILQNEGLNHYLAMDISQVTASTLSAYDVVILGEFPLTSSQASMFSSWVQAGGNLITMRPDLQLAATLGLNRLTGSLSNAYLLLNTNQGPGLGLVNQTIQFHGPADLYSLGSATSLATLYSNAVTATSSPAATQANYGSGRAAAFTYDLARSVVYSRQGNPAWSGMERDGLPPIRSDDLFFGNATQDPQPDWIDLNKVAIPQADEQQRLLANLILEMNQSKKPLPRFWYFPNNYQAVVIMTGDDHANGGTVGRFNTYIADSTPGCSVANWQCIRGTSYVYPGTPMTDAQAQAFVNQGFEVALHVTTNCADWTPTSLESFYATQLASWQAQYVSEPAPQTNRTHCIAESDFDTQPQIELNHGIRFDTNYYYWPPSWIQDRPGMFTGSGMPMRFAKTDGTRIDVYQAATQMTDESGQSFPFTIDTLLGNAVGPLGYYGAFTANMHNDSSQSSGADAIVASAQSHGVPVVTSLQMLHWLDGRNQSSFESINWAGNTLQFNVIQAPGANGLQAMLPTVSAVGLLGSVKLNGNPVTYLTKVVKGIQYAIFPAAAGTFTATYAADTTAPVITNLSSSAGTDGTAVISWTTDKVSSSTVSYNDGVAFKVASAPGSLTSHSVTLTGLSPSTTYFYQVASTDSFGNTATAPATPASFQTPAAMLLDTTAANFAGGTGSCSAVNIINSGAVILSPSADVEFPGTTLPVGWSSGTWSSGGGYTVAGGAVTVDGADVFSGTSYGPGVSLEFVGTFSGQPFQHIGFVADGGFNAPWAIFSTGAGGNALYARVNPGSDIQIPIPGNWLGTPHRFRIDWTATSFIFSIDGTVVVTQPTAINSNMVLVASDATPSGGNVSLNWMRLSPYAVSCSFMSRVLDAGGPSTWSSMAWTADTPTGTSLGMSYRFGNTPTPDGSWTTFLSLGASPAPLGGNSRYIQYQASLATTDATHTPALSNVDISFTSGVDTTPPTVTGQSPTPGATNVPVGTVVTATFSKPMNPATIKGSTMQLQDSSSNVIPAAVTYANNTATLTPNAPLAATTQYQVTVAGAVADLSGNLLGTNVNWTFTTGLVTLSHTDTTVADFSAGSTACSVVAHTGNGEVTLAPTVDQEFNNSMFPSDWVISPWTTGGTATVTGGQLGVDGALAATSAYYGPGKSLDFVATFGADTYQHVGFLQTAATVAGESWAMFSTAGTTNSLFARINNNGTTSDILIPPPALGSWIGTPHHFRIDWMASSVVFSIDGNIVSTQNVAITANMRPGVSDFNTNGITVSVDWMLMTPYTSPCNFQSAVVDAGSAASWSNLSWTAITPANTTLILSYRTGSTPVPDGTWSTFTPVATSGGPLTGNTRYLQYEADLSTTDPSQTPILADVTVTYASGATQGPVITSVNTAAFKVGTAGTFIVTASGTPAPTLSEFGQLPANLTFLDNGNGTATISGISNAGTGGQYLVTIVAHNSSGPDANQNFTLNINEAPAITSANNAAFSVGDVGSFTVTASGYPASTFSETGTLPVGVTLNAASGALSGTPAANASGSYSLTLTAHNGVAPDATQAFTLVVSGPPTITSANNANLTVGVNGSFTVTASGYPVATLSESGSLPNGVTFTSATGVLGGTPAPGTDGVFPITFTAHNGIGTDATQNFTLTVGAAPSITTSPGNRTINAGQTAILTVTATGTAPLTYQWYQGLTGDTSTPVGIGNASFTTPPLSATTNYWVRVSNALGHADSQTATITVTVPVIVFSPTTLAFAGQPLGTNSAPKTLTIRNSGNGALVIAGFSFNPSGEFSVTNPGNCPTSLAPAGTCTVQVVFNPVNVGGRTAFLTLSSNAPASPSVSLSGTGVAPVVVSPTTLKFANQAVGTTSVAQTVTVLNQLKTTLSISVSSTGPFSVVSNGCASPLAPLHKCSVTVAFAPTALGAASGALRFLDSAITSPQTVALSGTGIAGVKLTPASSTFTATKVGKTSGNKLFTLMNTQPGTLTITQIATSNSDFNVVSTSCGGTLVSGGQCTISVNFTPKAKGARTGQLQISDDYLTSPQVAALSGTGQ